MLHIVNKSPTERNNLDSCLRLAQAGSVILLIEDAVYAAMANTETAARMKQASETFNFFVLAPDLKARGLTDLPLIQNIELIDYDGFVELTEQHTNIHSWL